MLGNRVGHLLRSHIDHSNHLGEPTLASLVYGQYIFKLKFAESFTNKFTMLETTNAHSGIPGLIIGLEIEANVPTSEKS